jgi:hypothetical protein
VWWSRSRGIYAGRRRHRRSGHPAGNAGGWGGGGSCAADRHHDQETRLVLAPTGVTSSLPAEQLPGLLSAIGVDPAFADVYASNQPAATPGDIFVAIFTDLAFTCPRHISQRPRRRRRRNLPVSIQLARNRSRSRSSPRTRASLRIRRSRQRCGSNAFGDQVPPHVLADTMHRAWVDFAHGHSPSWDRYNSIRRPRYELRQSATTDTRPTRGRTRTLAIIGLYSSSELACHGRTADTKGWPVNYFADFVRPHQRLELQQSDL